MRPNTAIVRRGYDTKNTLNSKRPGVSLLRNLTLNNNGSLASDAFEETNRNRINQENDKKESRPFSAVYNNQAQALPSLSQMRQSIEVKDRSRF